jgi:dTDP-4-amino-4,6-dideoxy-D-galactose acyltransferase
LIEPAQILTWDSEFFGCRIARARDGSCEANEIADLEAWCAAQQVDCLYLLADATDRCDLLQDRGFLMVDVRLTLDRRLVASRGSAVPRQEVRFARADDLSDLAPIARRAHLDSRFYYDSRFADDRCDDLYEHWLARSIDGWADTVLVAEHGGRAAGYVTCHRGAAGVGSIGLVGVGESARGVGLGRGLISAALDWFTVEGLERVEVVTQGRNVPAQRLYQSQGFRTLNVALWFHRWTDRGEEVA